jgi:hypothetical protein
MFYVEPVRKGSTTYSVAEGEYMLLNTHDIVLILSRISSHIVIFEIDILRQTFCSTFLDEPECRSHPEVFYVYCVGE